MRPGEGEGSVGQAGGEPGVGAAQGGQVRGREPDDQSMRDDRALPVADPARFHRAFDPTLDLDRAEPGPEQAC